MSQDIYLNQHDRLPFVNRAVAVTRPEDPCWAYLHQAKHWALIDVLRGGTHEIRKKRQLYLPQEPREQDASYDSRLNRSVLSPYLMRIAQLIVGLVLRKEVALDEVSDQFLEHAYNIDLTGNNLQVFTRKVLEIAVLYGHAGVLVDMPTEDQPVLTLAEEMDANRRPYWVLYEPKDILGWRTTIKGGVEQLTQVRLRELIMEPDGEFGEKMLYRIRVLEPGNWRLYTQVEEGGRYELSDQGTTSLEYIPFSVCYADKIRALESRPPLLDVAHLNLKHFQVQSDLDWMLHISAVPMLAFFGFPNIVDEVTVGPNEAINFPSDGKAQYIEPGGASFSAQESRLAKIEHEINTLSLAAIAGQKMTAETAQAKRIDRSQGDAGLNTLAQGLEDCLDNCLMFHSAYLGEKSGTVKVNRDFIDVGLDPAEINAYMQLWVSQAITHKTLLEILQDGDVFAGVTEFDVEKEIEMTQQSLVEKQDQDLEMQARQQEQQAAIAAEYQPDPAEQKKPVSNGNQS
jgi:hypothetical protein